ncbi:GDP-mannose 4,6-dehydratase [Halorubrum tebenquichense]|uniref:GDP-mannose 4,6-dehydratase n=1 Tax=Halorubrum tebenquichense DSM 14210 TaxID=1227485 RepID=M0DZA0_9EURY|nr:GDP-mannose 4,6-dehydratase [Halorubrum tebenquichense]ELZ39419.1 GDP-mannose 4,6-dehydratase [Halorubrum tebenquichense DSM 14210]
MSNTALITGVTGQDGSYLAEYLLSKGYDVYGLERWKSTQGHRRIDHITDLELVQGDLADQSSLDRVVRETRPDEVYNLAALSFVPESFNQPVHTGNITGLGATRVLEAVRKHQPDAKFYQASTSELFGNSSEETQSIDTPFQPRSPYGTSKLYAYWSTVNYREAHDMFTVNGVLFNHESPRRGKNFVTRKITRGAAAISLGLQDKLELGNLDAKRDWGHAEDYVKAMHLMLQQDTPKDLVIGTGEHHSVRDCARIAFNEVGLDWEDYVEINEKFFRPAEVDVLKADISNAKSELDWEPQKTFEDLIVEMVETDLAELQSDNSQAAQPNE